jgi:phage major head subunit gpT-like protein
MPRTNLDTLSSRAILGMYYRTLQQVESPAFVNKIAMVTDSTQAIETYQWLGQSPAMREWIGGRLAKQLSLSQMQIVNKPFESTEEFTEDDLREDKTGQLQLRINEQIRRAAAHPAKLLSTLIAVGKSTACYDGQFYFDTDHSEGQSGTQSNDLTFAAATGTTPTEIEMTGAILQSIKAIYGFRDDQGEPMNEDATSFLIMVPTALWDIAQGAVKNEYVANGASNTLKNTNFNIEVVPNARLTDATEMYTFRTDSQVKPLIVQQRQPIKVGSKGEGSEFNFDTDRQQFGVTWKGNVGYGFWQDAVLTTFT